MSKVCEDSRGIFRKEVLEKYSSITKEQDSFIPHIDLKKERTSYLFPTGSDRKMNYVGTDGRYECLQNQTHPNLQCHFDNNYFDSQKIPKIHSI